MPLKLRPVNTEVWRLITFRRRGFDSDARTISYAGQTKNLTGDIVYMEMEGPSKLLRLRPAGTVIFLHNWMGREANVLQDNLVAPGKIDDVISTVS